jgi:hypothetical protein
LLGYSAGDMERLKNIDKFRFKKENLETINSILLEVSIV